MLLSVAKTKDKATAQNPSTNAVFRIPHKNAAVLKRTDAYNGALHCSFTRITSAIARHPNTTSKRSRKEFARAGSLTRIRPSMMLMVAAAVVVVVGGVVVVVVSRQPIGGTSAPGQANKTHARRFVCVCLLYAYDYVCVVGV